LSTDARDALKMGSDVISDLMLSHGFVFVLTSTGVGSGGPFATGEFRRGNRILELHFRYSLGLVTYRVGGLELSHEDYMWSVVGQRFATQYPGFSADPMDGFRRLLVDLSEHCVDFLSGSDSEFIGYVERARKLKEMAPRLP